MSRGIAYLGLIANTRQEDYLYEARNRRRSRQPIRPRRSGGIGAAILRALRIKR